jgi:hypothetical protein
METMEIAVWLGQIINDNLPKLVAAYTCGIMGDDDDIYKSVAQVENPALFVLPRVPVGRLADAVELITSDYIRNDAKRLALMAAAASGVLFMKGLNDQFSVAVLNTKTKNGFSFKHLGADDVGIAPIYTAASRA